MVVQVLVCAQERNKLVQLTINGLIELLGEEKSISC